RGCGCTAIRSATKSSGRCGSDSGMDYRYRAASPSTPGCAAERETELAQVELRTLARVREEALQHVAQQTGVQAVEIGLAGAADPDQPRHAQERQVMADGRLRLPEHLAQSRDVRLPLAGQGQKNAESRVVRQQLEVLHQAGDRPVRDRQGRRVLLLCGRG